MNTIIDNVSCLVDHYSNLIKQEIVSRFGFDQPGEIDTLSQIFDEINVPFNELNTEAMQKSFIKSNFPYVAPEKIVLGSILSRKRKISGCTISEKEEFFMYVPLIQSLKQLLGNQKIASLLLRKPYITKPGVYYDLFDGSVFINDAYFQQHPDALVLIIYHDELEVCNPLGSSAGLHKLDMYYYCIANIPPKYRSRHCAVSLLAIAKAALVKKYGVEKILSPIIDDLLLLFNGFEMEVNGKEKFIYGKILVCLGDTLGQHLWGGFKEGVGVSFQKCRQCFCDFESLQNKYSLKDFTLRTPALYNQHCSEIETATNEGLRNDLKSCYGINKRSALCELPDFNITKQLPQDLMHIAFEGFVQYELRLVLEKFFNDKLTTLKQVNGSIASHNFGYSEISSKPAQIKETVFTGDERYKLKQKAKQAHLFLRLFPFIVGPLVDMENEYFSFVLDLIDIVQLLCSPVIRRDTVNELDNKIANHFSKFKQIFPDKNLLPKHHYLLHIPQSILEFGPPSRYSCFSFEAAHSYFKSLARLQNFKNISLSLAKRHQYLQTCNFCDTGENSSSHPLFAKEKNYGVVKELDHEAKSQLRDRFNEFGLLPGVQFNHVFKVSWIMRYGTKYNCNSVIAVDADPVTELPKFGKVNKIICVHDFVYFEVELYKTIDFSYHLQSYRVEKLPGINLSYYSYTSLLDYNVFHVKRVASGGDEFIQTKYSVRDIILEHISGSNPLHD